MTTPRRHSAVDSLTTITIFFFSICYCMAGYDWLASVSMLSI